MGHFLERALELVGDLLGHLLGRGTRPENAQRHRAKRERRVFVLAELEVGRRAEQQHHDQQVARQRRMVERPFRDVESRPRAGRGTGRVSARHGGRRGPAHCTLTAVPAGARLAAGAPGSI